MRPKPSYIILLPIAWFVIFGELSAAPASPEPGDTLAATSGSLELELAPSSLTLRPGEESRVELILRNDTNRELVLSSSTLLTPPHLRITARAVRNLSHIDPQSTETATIRVKALDGFETGKWSVIIRGAVSGAPSTLATASMEVTAGAPPDKLDVAFVDFPDQLHDGQTVMATLRISNTTQFDARDVSLTFLGSEDLKLSLESPTKACPSENLGRTNQFCFLGPSRGQSLIIPIKVRADNQVRTGKQTVGILVVGHRDSDGMPMPVSYTSGSATLSIFGLDVVSPFGIATLFVVPGLVAVMIFLIASRWIYPRILTLPDLVDFTNPGTMLYTIPPAALVYAVVWYFLGRDLSAEAGTGDVVALFALGGALGMLAWLILAVVYYARTGRKVFSKGDDPVTVLRKIGLRRGKLVLRTASVHGASYRYLTEGQEGKAIVCPTVRYEFSDSASPQSRSQWRQQFEAGDPTTLARLAKSGQPQLSWASPSGVMVLDREELGELGEERPLLEEWSSSVVSAG
jgi:hypothetical protein